MAQTISQIVDQAASLLGKKATGQSVQGSVSADLTQAYNEVWASLSRLSLVTFSSTDDVPDEYARPMAYLVANQRKDGVSNDRYQRIVAEVPGALGAISTIKEGVWTNPLEVEDF